MIVPQEIYHPLYTDKEKFIILITGGRGSGKSFNAATFIERLTFELTSAERIVHQILYTRYTMVSANMSIIPEMMEKIQLDGTDKYFSTTKTDVVNKMTNSHIMFRGIKTSSGNQTAKLKSIHGITTFVCDEAEEWTSEQDFEKIMLSIRQKGIQNRIIIIMNPTDSNHFIYKRYIENTHKLVNIDGVDVQISTHPNVLHIHTTYLDNIDNLSPQFIDEVQRMKVENPEKYGHTVIGRWADVAEGAVFKKWGIVKEFPAWAKKIALGQDFGYSNDVSATVRCGIIDNALYVDELCYQAGMLTNDLANTLRPWGLKVFSESADPRLIQEIKNRGVNIYPVDKSSIDGKGSIIAGIEKIKDMELFVTERSYNLIKELRNYVWDKDKDGNYINTPVDKDNHCFTGDTLITTYEGEKRIDRITVDDYVLTSKGYKKINKLFDNGFRKVLHIRLIFTDFIVEVKATPDHKFKTKDGWKQLQQLTKGDVLYLCKSSMAKSIDCTQANAILQEENIRCTEKYGNSIMARYQKDTMYTIKMKIDSTTQLKTSNCLNLGNILVSTCKSICNKMVLLMNSGSEWMKPESMRINGMDQKKEWNGIVNMGRWLLKTLNQKSLFANNADVNLKKSHKGKLNFAPTSVNLHIDERQALIMKQDTANSVGNRLLLGNTSKVNIVARNVRQNIYQKQRGCPMLKKRVQFAERSFSLDQRQGENSFAAGNVQGNIPQPFDLKEIEIVGEGICNVYDLNVNDEHEYFANGILVHNCMDSIRYYVLGCLLGRILKPKDLTGVFTH